MTKAEVEKLVVAANKRREMGRRPGRLRLHCPGDSCNIMMVEGKHSSSSFKGSLRDCAVWLIGYINNDVDVEGAAPVRNPSGPDPSWSKSEERWRRRDLILPIEGEDGYPGAVELLYSWHGGQGSSVYSLASTGDHELVSQSMIDAAMGELERDKRKEKPRSKRRKELDHLLSELEGVRHYPDEHSAKEAGMFSDERNHVYEYDDWSEWPEKNPAKKARKRKGRK